VRIALDASATAGPVEEYSLSAPAGFQDFSQEGTGPAAHINDRTTSREVIEAGNLLG
jgi:hypothetical protein